MVFSGGRAPSNLKFYFKGSELQIVDEYKYFGIFFSRSGTFLRTKKRIPEQANIALLSLLRKIRALNLPIHMHSTFLIKQLNISFYTDVRYGDSAVHRSVERVQLKFFKHILNLKKSTPSFMIYGKLGVYPLEIDIKSRPIAYWTKLIKNEINSTACNMSLIICSLNEQRKLKNKVVR